MYDVMEVMEQVHVLIIVHDYQVMQNGLVMQRRIVVVGDVSRDIQNMEIHVKKIVQYVEQLYIMENQEHVMQMMIRHDHVVQNQENVMMERHHELLDILIVIMDVKNHGIMSI